MADLHQEKGLRALASAINEALEMIYGQEVGFFLTVFPLKGELDIVECVRNVSRETACQWTNGSTSLI